MQKNTFNYQDERFADLQLLRYRVDGFETLSLRQKLLTWHLVEAALWGRDILWHQNCRYNLDIRTLLEKAYVNFSGERSSETFKAFEVYLKRVWFSNGIHHHYATDKIMPELTRKEFEAIIEQSGMSVEENHELIDIIFSTTKLTKRVNQAQGEDLLLTSACNYYEEGITQHEAEVFYAEKKAKSNADHPLMWGMNSQLVRNNEGKLEERVWKEEGMYGSAIKHITEHLEAALPYAESTEQKNVIELLVEFYRTGDLETFDRYTIAWVENTLDRIDFTNGFTEVYGDPLGLKASWEGYANFTDLEATHRATSLSENAQWFEDHSPVDERFKKKECRGVSAKVITATILGGDLYPSSAIGINLPNSDWVRANHGSKSVTIGNLTKAYDEAAKTSGMRQEFVIDEETIKLINDYGHVCDDLHTDLHECLGHGSGQLLPNVSADALKSYASTIEEARADLFGLYYLADAKLVALGLTPNEEAYKAQYYNYMLNGLMTQLVRIEPGRNIEEAHMRNRALIAHWVLENYPEVVCMIKTKADDPECNCSEKTYIKINDYAKLREAFGKLLAEIQRIKSEGDYTAAMNIVETYGVKVDPTLHAEVLLRYKSLNLAPYKGFINPRYELVKTKNGEIKDVIVDYDETFAQQQLRYSKEYASL